MLRVRREPRDAWEPAAAWSESCAERWGARVLRDVQVQQEQRVRPEPQERQDVQEQRVPAAPWQQDAEQWEAQEHQEQPDAGA